MADLRGSGRSALVAVCVTHRVRGVSTFTQGLTRARFGLRLLPPSITAQDFNYQIGPSSTTGYVAALRSVTLRSQSKAHAFASTVHSRTTQPNQGKVSCQTPTLTAGQVAQAFKFAVAATSSAEPQCGHDGYSARRARRQLRLLPVALSHCGRAMRFDPTIETDARERLGLHWHDCKHLQISALSRRGHPPQAITRVPCRRSLPIPYLPVYSLAYWA